MKPWKSPNAIRVQAYTPPSRGCLDDRLAIATVYGAMNVRIPNAHTSSPILPSGIVCEIVLGVYTATILRRIRSRSFRARFNPGRDSVIQLYPVRFFRHETA